MGLKSQRRKKKTRSTSRKRKSKSRRRRRRSRSRKKRKRRQSLRKMMDFKELGLSRVHNFLKKSVRDNANLFAYSTYTIAMIAIGLASFKILGGEMPEMTSVWKSIVEKVKGMLNLEKKDEAESWWEKVKNYFESASDDIDKLKDGVSGLKEDS